MDLDSNDYLEDYTTDEFKQKAAEQIQKQSQEAEESRAIQKQKEQSDAELINANIEYTAAQTKYSR